jgi:hypothetical protein
MAANFFFVVGKLFLCRSEIVGGIANEISGLTDGGRLLELLEGTIFRSWNGLYFVSFPFCSTFIFGKT